MKPKSVYHANAEIAEFKKELEELKAKIQKAIDELGEVKRANT